MGVLISLLYRYKIHLVSLELCCFLQSGVQSQKFIKILDKDYVITSWKNTLLQLPNTTPLTSVRKQNRCS